MKALVKIWFFMSLVGFPMILNLENGKVLAFIAVNLLASFLTARRVTPELFK